MYNSALIKSIFWLSYNWLKNDRTSWKFLFEKIKTMAMRWPLVPHILSLWNMSNRQHDWYCLWHLTKIQSSRSSLTLKEAFLLLLMFSLRNHLLLFEKDNFEKQRVTSKLQKVHSSIKWTPPHTHTLPRC